MPSETLPKHRLNYCQSTDFVMTYSVMGAYKARIADKVLKEKLEGKGAVLIEGAKWCGKATTASQVAKGIRHPVKIENNL